MKNIYEVLKEKEQEHGRLTVQLRDTNARYTKLSQEIDAMRLTLRLLAESKDQTSEQENKEFSQPQMVRAVLMENGSEMHLSDILKGVNKKFGKSLNPNVAAAVIFRYAKRNSTFYKVADKPNTWGLLEWRGVTKSIFPPEEIKAFQ
jgi:hypothetical protein